MAAQPISRVIPTAIGSCASMAGGSPSKATPATPVTASTKVKPANPMATAISLPESPHEDQKRARTALPVTAGKPSVWLMP